jgi:hypothetical protein
MAVLGFIPKDADRAVLLPPPDRVIGHHDHLVVIAENGAAVPIRDERRYEPVDWRTAEPVPLNVVMIGWNDIGSGLLDRLAGYLPEGSRVEVMADTTLLRDGAPAWSWSIKGAFTHTKHDPAHVLGMISEVGTDVVTVLGYSDGMTDDEADSMTLLTLLTLDRARQSGRMGSERIVAHLFDSDLAQLARAHGECDFVITDALASRMLVHTSRRRHLGSVFAELFDGDGPIVDAVEVDPGTVPYGSVTARLLNDGFVPLGVITGGRVTLNPPNQDTIEFQPGDQVVVARPSRLRDVLITVEKT